MDTVLTRQKNNNYIYENTFIYNDKGKLTEFTQIILKDNKISNGYKYINSWINDDILNQTYSYGLMGDEWRLYNRVTYTYDIDDILIEQLIEIPQNNSWVNDRRNFYLYTSTKKKEAEYYQKWDGQGWVNLGRKFYSYDSKDSLLINLSESVVDNQWVYDYRFTKVYDEQGNLIENKYEKWNNWKLTDYWKYNYSYYPNRLIETMAYERMIKESYVPIFKFHYIYDENKNIVTKTEYTWKDVEWVGRERINYIFNKKMLLSQSIYEKIWNDKWTEYKKLTYSYSEFDKISEIYEESFGTQWNPRSKEIYEYDSNRNEIFWRKQEIFNDEFFDKYKILTNYNNYGFVAEIVSFKQDFENWKWDSVNTTRKFILSDSNEDYKFDGFYYLYATYKNLENTSIIISDKSSDNILISPNPANSFIKFKTEIDNLSISVFDERGYLVKFIPKSDGLFQEININDLPSGTYFILSGNTTQKFIKQ